MCRSFNHDIYYSEMLHDFSSDVSNESEDSILKIVHIYFVDTSRCRCSIVSSHLSLQSLLLYASSLTSYDATINCLVQQVANGLFLHPGADFNVISCRVSFCCS